VTDQVSHTIFTLHIANKKPKSNVALDLKKLTFISVECETTWLPRQIVLYSVFGFTAIINFTTGETRVKFCITIYHNNLNVFALYLKTLPYSGVPSTGPRRKA
jgi:hypothetical protein